MPGTQWSLSISLSKITRDTLRCANTRCEWTFSVGRQQMPSQFLATPCFPLLFNAISASSASKLSLDALDPPSGLCWIHPLCSLLQILQNAAFLHLRGWADAFLWPLNECVRMFLWLCCKGCLYGYLKYQIYWKFPRGTHMPDFILYSHGNHASNKYSLWLSVTSVDRASLPFTYTYKLCI